MFFHPLLGEFCQMVDRDGRQVLMCTWGKKVLEDEMDFTMFGDFEHSDLIDINVSTFLFRKFEMMICF